MTTSVHLNAIDGALSTYDNTATRILQVPMTEPDISIALDVQILARRPDNSDAKIWKELLLVDKTAGGTPTQAALIHVMAPTGNLGTSLWNFSLTFDATHVNLNVIGAAANQVNWLASAWGMQVMGD
jgi:hypothetical protein